MSTEQRIERLTAWLDKQGQQANDYVSHKDNINSYAELFEGDNLFFGEIDSDVRDQVEAILENMDASDIFDYCDVDIHHGLSRRSNEIWSTSIGEIEHQYDTVGYEQLCSTLTPNDILLARRACEWHLSNGYLYLDCSYDRVSLVLRVDELLAAPRENIL